MATYLQQQLNMIGLPQQTNRDLSTDMRRSCTIVVDEGEILIPRRMPQGLNGIFGFIEWNRLCDRFDDSLKPLRDLALEHVDRTTQVPARDEEVAKTMALEALQGVCEKVSKIYPCLEFTLYCPFHTSLVSNWHIHIDVLESKISQPSAPDESPPTHVEASLRQVSESDSSTIYNTEESYQAQASNEDQGVSGLEATKEEAVTPSGSNAPHSFAKRSGKGVLGVDYIEHEVLPTDTLGGICLAYNISATRLKQANLMSGEYDSLLLAPKVLAIPKSEGIYCRAQDTDSKDYMVNSMMRDFKKLGRKEAKAYLELADWVLEEAQATAREDIEWEKQVKESRI